MFVEQTQLAALALKFLQRGTFKGREVFEYAAVHNWLETLRQQAAEEGQNSSSSSGPEL